MKTRSLEAASPNIQQAATTWRRNSMWPEEDKANPTIKFNFPHAVTGRVDSNNIWMGARKLTNGKPDRVCQVVRRLVN